jgi:hypothetical protein
MAKQEFDNKNKGAMFTNNRKAEVIQSDPEDAKAIKWPDFQGSIDVNGIEYWLSGWRKKIKKGKREGEWMISLGIKPKEDQEDAKSEEKSAPQGNEDDNCPF